MTFVLYLFKRQVPRWTEGTLQHLYGTFMIAKSAGRAKRLQLTLPNSNSTTHFGISSKIFEMYNCTVERTGIFCDCLLKNSIIS